MSSALFDASGAYYNPKRPIYIHERGTSIPAFYEPHTDLNVTVRQDNVPVPPGFTVHRVPPERRWAIRPSGELIPQIEFERLYMLHYEDHIRHMDGDEKKVPGKANCQPMPTVRAYVSVELDPRDPSKLIQMGYDPFPKPQKEANQTLYDADGENPVSGDDRMKMLCDAYEENPDALTDLELREVLKYQRSQKPKAVSPEPVLEPINEPAPKKVSKFQKRKDFLAKKKKEPREPAAGDKRKGYVEMACGVMEHVSRRAKHVASCDQCSGVTVGPDAA